MRRRSLLLGALAGAAFAAALYRRIGFRPRERAEVRFQDGSTISRAGSPDVDAFATHAREALAAATGEVPLQAMPAITSGPRSRGARAHPRPYQG